MKISRRCLVVVAFVGACSATGAGSNDPLGGNNGTLPPGALDPNLGITWSSVTTGTKANLHDVVWAGSRFVAVGDQGTVLSSNDGSSWSTLPPAVGVDFRHVIWTGSML